MKKDKPTPIIAVSNNKGGVGKTVSSITLASLMANSGLRVLLIDLDAQANATCSLLPSRQSSDNIYTAMVKHEPLPIQKVEDLTNAGRLDLVPATLHLSWLDMALADQMGRELILKELLDPITTEYDVIILDCPPNLGLIAQNAFCAATDILIPLHADSYSKDGLKIVINFLKMVRQRLNPALSLLGILITQFEQNTDSQLYEKALRESYPSYMFDAKIRKNVAVRKAQTASRLVTDMFPQSHASQDYRSLFKEIMARLSLTSEIS